MLDTVITNAEEVTFVNWYLPDPLVLAERFSEDDLRFTDTSAIAAPVESTMLPLTILVCWAKVKADIKRKNILRRYCLMKN